MSRRASLLVIAGAIGLSLVLLCVFIAAIANGTYLMRASTGPINRIAYVDNNSNIQVVDAHGANRVALTTDASGTRAYLFPTWSPDSQRLAFVGVTSQGSARDATIYTAPAGGGSRATVFESQTDIPFYVYWSPDSQRIGFLAQSDTVMALMLGSADGKTKARQIGTGAPFYWAWSPDSRTLLMHIGGSVRDSSDAELALFGRDSTSAPQILKFGPADFQAPHFSPDGSKILFAATTSSADDALYLADSHGNNAHAIANYQGTIAFAWSPNGKKIASLVTPADAGLPYLGPVWVSDADGSHRVKLIDEDALAFYWSPDSQRIAYLTLAPPGGSTSSLNVPLPQTPLNFTWRVMNLADKQARTVATFVPTQDFFSVLPYFDQYSRSLTFWSPDSQHLVYTKDDNNGIGSVWVADATGKTAAQKIGDGTLAVWSWK
jgi:Tol biopolymer transport system component